MSCLLKNNMELMMSCTDSEWREHHRQSLGRLLGRVHRAVVSEIGNTQVGR